VDDSAAKDGDEETAGVRVFPPLLFAAGLGLGLAAGAVPQSSTYGTRARRLLGTLSIAIGAAAIASAATQLKRAGSNVSPFAPTTALVTTGIFRFTRNPMYFGLTSIYLGVALITRSIPAFVTLPVTLALADRLVVDREERYLEARFGERYRNYKADVPRWF
jgi:protein-S-isoprenylcysteine O-methyltransferase Ste14